MPRKLNLFGSFNYLDENNIPMKFRSAKTRALFAYLSIEADRPHQRLSLATMFWSEFDRQKGLKNLRVTLTHIRKVIPTDLLTTNRQMLQLNSSAEFKIDVTEFEQLIREADSHPQADLVTSEVAIEKLRTAMALYQGEFLAGFEIDQAEGFESWQTIQREALQSQAERALQILIAHDTMAGDSNKLLQSAHQLIAISPWSEIAHRAIMRVLANNGNRAGAMQQYEMCREIVWEEIGVEPEPETEALKEEIASGKIKAVELTHTFARPVARNNLPRLTMTLVGRSAEIERLSGLLKESDYPYITLTGPGGIGKTQLAIKTAHELAADWQNRIWFVSLEALSNSANEYEIAHEIGVALEVDVSSTNNLLTNLVERINSIGSAIIILDNCEQFVENADFLRITQQLIEKCSQLQLVATSRQPLDLQAEYIVQVGGLPVPNSAELSQAPVTDTSIGLFIDRAQQVVQYPANYQWPLEKIREICVVLDGNPLAIELTAANLRHSTIDEMLSELTSNIKALSVEQHGRPTRHRSMQAVFDYSWQLLSSAERETLAKLTVFRGAFDRTAVQAVTQTDPNQIETLVTKSLIKLSKSGGLMPNQQYQLLEAVRQFASEKLSAHLTEEECHRLSISHATHYLTNLSAKTDFLRGGHQQETLAEINEDIDNIQAAWTFSCQSKFVPGLGLAIDALHHFYDMQSWFYDGALAMEAVIENIDPQEMLDAEIIDDIFKLVGKSHARAGWFRFLLGEHQQGQQSLETGLKILQDGGFSAETTFCHNYLAATHMHLSAYEKAAFHGQQAIQTAKEHADSYGEMLASNIIGRIHLLQGQLDEAAPFLNSALSMAQQSGNRWSTSYSLEYLGRLALAKKDVERAKIMFSRSLAVRQLLNDQRGQGVIYITLGEIAERQSELAEAESLYTKALTIFTSTGNTLNRATAQNHLDMLGINVFD